MQHVNPADLQAYTTSLRRALDDKLFFINRIPDDVNVFVDFGCADGALLKAVNEGRFGKPGSWKNLYLGYDHDPAMLHLADRATSFDPAYTFTADFERLKADLSRLHRGGFKSCLILSSVLHEVLSQGPTFEDFWINVVKPLGCDYVVFRDMAVEAKLSIEATPTAWYNSAFVREDAEDIARALSFEQTHGSLTCRDNFIHFLLKVLHPLEDWAKENAERYLALSAEAYLNFMTVGSGYKLRHFEHTTIPEIQAEWFSRFGIDVPDPTHLKLILKKGW